jgi:hypothetical protein
MLLRTVLLPSVLSSIPANPDAAELFFPLVIRLLQDLSENCTIVVDDRNTSGGIPIGVADLYTAIEKWPEKFRIPASKAIQALQKAKRVVVIGAAPEPREECVLPECRHIIGLTMRTLAKDSCVVIAGGGCTACCLGVLPQERVVSITDYPASEFLLRRKEAMTVLLGDGDWTHDRFEEKILTPVLRDSQLIKLYDRMIAAKMLPREAARAGPVSCSIPANYSLTIQWILATFARCSSAADKKAEIYTTVDTSYMDKNHLAAVTKGAESFVAEMMNKTGVRPTLFLKSETPRMRMPYGRYLITDRVGILVERGFDLLWDDAAMIKIGRDPSKHPRPVRDVMLSNCPYSERIETSTAKLRDFQIIR